MVSPSKVQKPNQKRIAKWNIQDKPTQPRNDRRKPLEGKSFYLDLKNHTQATKLEAKIKELGGTIEVFLVRSVTIVVSDKVDKSGLNNSEKQKWGYTSRGSGGHPSLRSIEAPTPTPPTPLLSTECPLVNSTNLRGQTSQRSKSRVDAMLERALTQPQQCSVDPLENAQTWGIPIWAVEKLQAWLDRTYASFKDTKNFTCVDKNQRNQEENKGKHLKPPYIKFESFHRESRPVFFQLPVWPVINFNSEPGTCPFDNNPVKRVEISKPPNKGINENKNSPYLEKKGTDMTRRPRNATTRARRAEHLGAGYCEICRIDYKDLSKHVQTDQHLNFVKNDDNFLSLDTLIGAGASVEAFLKLNRSKDIRKDCNLFPNDDRSLQDVMLPGDKNVKTNLDEFTVNDFKVMQCNGARRNLNLKLSSPHNLRTRAKHESGHLLRSKGSPWREVEKSDKFYDKFEGYTIKKRAKGTIWIEEDDPDENNSDEEQKHQQQEQEEQEAEEETELKHSPTLEGCKNEETKERGESGKEPKRSEDANNSVAKPQNNKRNSVDKKDKSPSEKKVGSDKKDNENLAPIEDLTSTNKSNLNGFENFEKEKIHAKADDGVRKNCVNNSAESKIREEKNPLCNGHKDDFPKDEKTSKSNNKVMVKKGIGRPRNRQRLSVEERLIEDNRAYYKVEVLGNKLRSSAVHSTSTNTLNRQSPAKETPPTENSTVPSVKKEEDQPSSEKPVVVRFKRVRKSELTLLSDEAESFMFGEPKRDDSTSEISDNDQSSILPKDTSTEHEEGNHTMSSIESSPLRNSYENIAEEESSQDSIYMGRAKKRRRTQAEALIKDNTDYYKFEVPGSRLRYQAPLTGIQNVCEGNEGQTERSKNEEEERVIYPSKPSAEVEKMQFSFEAIPKSEPWYQTYQRQDNGSEYWHYFSENDTRQPFLLPYEIENFHEILMKSIHKSEQGNSRKKSKRGAFNNIRSPRKSPRCHASTLAIMSTIIRKREQQQQQQQPNLEVIQEEEVRSRTNTPDRKPESSNVDEDLREVATKIEEMLNAKSSDLEEESLETDLNEDIELNTKSGAPLNLLELLDNCHEVVNCMENSSRASSECGENGLESPLKRRKKRKNRTGWPGIKMKKKVVAKQTQNVVDSDNKPVNNSKLVEVSEHSNERLCMNKSIKKEIIESSDDNTEVKSPCSGQEPSVNMLDLIPEEAEEGEVEEDENEESEASESEDSLNDENLCSPSQKDKNGSLRSTKKRKRKNTSSSETRESLPDIENCEGDKEHRSVSSRKHRSRSSLKRKRRRRDNNEPEDDTGSLLLEDAEVPTRDTRQSRRSVKKEGFVSSPKRKQQTRSATSKRESETQDSEMERSLSDRVTSVPSSDLEQRRSSMEFQPVVRVMKIDDRVDTDHNILSVTVASNRRLRSSPRGSNNIKTTTNKRIKVAKGQINRWLKNS